MCCTDRELRAEGKKLPTDRWFGVKHTPCCIPKAHEQSTEQAKREREGEHNINTLIPCGRCQRNTLRFSRLVTHAEQHGGEELEVPVCELNCPCGAKVSMAAWVVREKAATRGVLLNV